MKNNFKIVSNEELENRRCSAYKYFKFDDMKNKIELKHWDYTCGDGCCYDYGVDLILNGESLTSYAESNLYETITLLLTKLNIDFEIEEIYEE